MWVAVFSATLYYYGKEKRQKKIISLSNTRGKTRDSHTYHYTALKTKRLTIENQKLKLRKYNPVKRKHEMFVEAKLPPHSK